MKLQGWELDGIFHSISEIKNDDRLSKKDLHDVRGDLQYVGMDDFKSYFSTVKEPLLGRKFRYIQLIY